MDQLRAPLAAEDLGRAVRDDLVCVRVRRCARACLVDVDRKLVVELAIDDLLRRRRDRPRPPTRQQSQLAVGLGGGSLDHAQGADPGAIGAGSTGALRALRKVLAGARKDGYDQLIACATEAVRRASDGRVFARQAGEIIGVPVRIIPGRREAELSFLGAASRHASRREWALVDLGGASTEVVVARGGEMLTSAALEIGSGVLASKFLSHPPKAEERARLRQAALRELTHAPDG